MFDSGRPFHEKHWNEFKGKIVFHSLTQITVIVGQTKVLSFRIRISHAAAAVFSRISRNETTVNALTVFLLHGSTQVSYIFIFNINGKISHINVLSLPSIHYLTLARAIALTPLLFFLFSFSGLFYVHVFCIIRHANASICCFSM